MLKKNLSLEKSSIFVTNYMKSSTSNSSRYSFSAQKKEMKSNMHIAEKSPLSIPILVRKWRGMAKDVASNMASNSH